ncbi:AAEL006894-PA [Aedes aegypti]|uniref:AAEL006894-PA n=1 Tax=Aedes aegypti TaxID=7159 RepID=Q174I8_AEDAE|nr:AAEL006894-PA [Aedes aegypti]
MIVVRVVAKGRFCFDQSRPHCARRTLKPEDTREENSSQFPASTPVHYSSTRECASEQVRRVGRLLRTGGDVGKVVWDRNRSLLRSKGDRLVYYF